MFETLFGAEMPLPVRFFIAFLIVLGLMGVTFWIIRKFGAERLGATTARGRQPRLAVIDAAPVDGRRRLILIRRDNVEHLLMIGGPTDVVVEANIVRAAAASAGREAPAPTRAPAAEALPRTAPSGDGGMWPLQPEPVPVPPPRPVRAPIPEEPVQWSMEPELRRRHRRVVSRRPPIRCRGLRLNWRAHLNFRAPQRRLISAEDFRRVPSASRCGSGRPCANRRRSPNPNPTMSRSLSRSARASRHGTASQHRRASRSASKSRNTRRSLSRCVPANRSACASRSRCVSRRLHVSLSQCARLSRCVSRTRCASRRRPPP